uniref:Ig-like domain-containing protein n=1 Tax=Pyxicephalus adspersus TaxID=30357 RepID=A0AAV3A7N0_PYXAD|nr:TPA: hypothetical protein GDO54_013704 [Pyxicephalus adspersus]
MVTQSSTDLLSKEGESVTFNCTYSAGYPTLMWYLQEPSNSIIFIQHDQSTTDDLIPRFKHRFYATFVPKERFFTLTISPVTAEDSGIYYCVLRLTVIKCHYTGVQEKEGYEVR